MRQSPICPKASSCLSLPVQPWASSYSIPPGMSPYPRPRLLPTHCSRPRINDMSFPISSEIILLLPFNLPVVYLCIFVVITFFLYMDILFPHQDVSFTRTLPCLFPCSWQILGKCFMWRLRPPLVVWDFTGELVLVPLRYCECQDGLSGCQVPGPVLGLWPWVGGSTRFRTRLGAGLSHRTRRKSCVLS